MEAAMPGEARKVAGLAHDQSKEQKKGSFLEAQKQQKKSSFCHADGHLSSHECGVGTKFSKYAQVGLCSEVTE